MDAMPWIRMEKNQTDHKISDRNWYTRKIGNAKRAEACTSKSSLHCYQQILLITRNSVEVENEGETNGVPWTTPALW